MPISYIFSTKYYVAIFRIEYLMTCSRCLGAGTESRNSTLDAFMRLGSP